MYAQHSPALRGPSEMWLLNIMSGRKKKWFYLTRTHLSKALKRSLYQQINDGKNLVLRGASCKKECCASFDTGLIKLQYFLSHAMILTQKTFSPHDNPQQNCNSRLLLLLELFYVLESTLLRLHVSLFTAF